MTFDEMKIPTFNVYDVNTRKFLGKAKFTKMSSEQGAGLILHHFDYDRPIYIERYKHDMDGCAFDCDEVRQLFKTGKIIWYDSLILEKETVFEI
jgi:hypothetical protein